MFNFKPLPLAITASALLCSGAAIATNGMISHGYSSIDKAMGGAGVAYSQDAMSMATNPAGLVFLKANNTLDFNLAAFMPKRGYNTTGDPSPGMSIGPQELESENSIFPNPSLAYASKINDQSTWGISLYGNGGMNTEYEGGNATMWSGETGHPCNSMQGCTMQGTYGAGTTGVDLMQVFINATLSSKLTENHAIGISFLLGMQSFEAQGLANFEHYSTDKDHLTNNGHDYSTGYGFKLGYQGRVTDTFSIGASYQSEMEMSKFDKYSGLFADHGQLNMPSWMQAGASWEAMPNWLIMADYQYILYSGVPAIGNSFDNFFNCTNQDGSANDENSCLGGTSGTGFGWNDMHVYKIGTQFDAMNITWRLGYSYSQQPIDGDSEILFNIIAPGVVEQHITAGLTKDITDTWSIHGSFMYAPRVEVKGNNLMSGMMPGTKAQEIDIWMEQTEVQLGVTYNF